MSQASAKELNLRLRKLLFGPDLGFTIEEDGNQLLRDLSPKQRARLIGARNANDLFDLLVYQALLGLQAEPELEEMAEGAGGYLELMRTHIANSVDEVLPLAQSGGRKMAPFQW